MTKNFKGGYKIVSLNGNDLASGDSFVVNGLYENLVNSYKKPILVTEIVIDGEKQQDSFAVVKQSDGGYKIDVYDYALTVTSEDAVTIAEVTQVNSIGGVSGDITLGTGLSITEDGELSSTGGSGTKYYMHNVSFYDTYGSLKLYFLFSYISTSSTPLTTYIGLRDKLGVNKAVIASGYANDGTHNIIVRAITFTGSGGTATLNIRGNDLSDNYANYTITTSTASSNTSDNVIEIQ